MIIAEKGLDLFETKKFKYFLRLLSVFLAIFCLITLHELDWDVDPYLSGKGVGRLLLGILANIGLWVITTNWAKKNTIKAILTLIPATIISTSIILMHSYILPVLFFLFMVALTYLVYKSGENEKSF